MIKKIIFTPFLILEKYYFNLALSTVCLLAYFSEVGGSSFNLETYLMLANSILMIYNFDYLRDNYKKELKISPSVVFRYLIILICLVVNLGLIYFFYQKNLIIIQSGIIISGVVIMYFFLLKFYHSFFIIKEFFVAATFTIMIALLLSALPSTSPLTWNILFSVLLLLFHNALIFSLGNQAKDEKNKTNSVVLYFGYERMLKVTDGVGFLGVIFILFNQSSFNRPGLGFYLIICFLFQGILAKNLVRIKNYQSNRNSPGHFRLLYLLGNSIFLFAYVFYLAPFQYFYHG